MKNRYSYETVEIKKDCKAYRPKEEGDKRCNALNELYCKKELCAFYKNK